jgi:phage shock protein A
LETLRRLVRKLGARYGQDDEDVVRLKAEMDELETKIESFGPERSNHYPRTFQTSAQEHFHASSQQAVH